MIAGNTIGIRFLVLERYVGSGIATAFLYSFYTLLCPIDRVLECSDVDSDLKLAIGGIRTRMGFDYMGYIKRLSFAMTDTNYLVIP